MKRFFYSAKDSKGYVQTGVVEAKDELQAKGFLEKKGLMVLWLGERKVSKTPLLFERISIVDKAVFMRQLATMTEAGFPIDKSLRIIEVETKNKRFQAVISSIAGEVEAGESLWRALSSNKEVFNPVIISVVKSGESAGRLPAVLKLLAKTLEAQASFTGSLWAALAYPIFVVVAMIVVGSIILTFFVPKIGSIFAESNTPLPWQTKVLISIGNFLVNYWWALLFLLFFALGYIYWYSTNTQKGRIWFERILLSLPVVGELLMRNQLTLFNQLFYLLLSSATPILEAIDLVAESMTFLIFKEALYSIKKRVAQGLPLAASFTQEPIFPTIESQLINVGEQTGTLEKMFERLMSYYQERTNEYVKKVISLLEPIVIVILAVGVAIMVWAVFGPIYGLVQLPTT